MRRSLNRRAQRLSREASHYQAELEEAWRGEAMARLSDEDLIALTKALRRITEEEWRTKGPDILTPAEQGAFARYEALYQEAKGCSG